MKRLIILSIIVVFAALCLGQFRSRVPPQRKIIQLTEPRTTGPLSFEEALSKRRSVRQFSGQPLKPADISQLAWAGQGITDREKGLRTAPSAGALYPMELYFAIPDGLFVYRPIKHSLEQILAQDVRGQLAAAASGQEAVARAGCDIVVAGSMKKLAAQFRNEARKYVWLEAGHIAQNIQLQAVCLGLGSVAIGGFDTIAVSRICRLTRDLSPIYIMCIGHQVTQTETEGQKPNKQVQPTRVKRAVLITARENFRDEELFETKRVLDAAAVQNVIASTRVGAIRGMLGNVAQAQILVNNIRVDDFDAIIFIGGSGAAEYFNHPAALNIAREAVRKGKILAAICIAPGVLANAGVLNGVRATSFLSERQRLIKAGAIYTGNPVERDRLIITGNGPLAAATFARAIVDALSGR